MPSGVTTGPLADPLEKTTISVITGAWACTLYLFHFSLVPLPGAVKLLRSPVVSDLLVQFWSDESGQDIAEYAVMLAVILVIVIGTVRLIGSSANTVFSGVASGIQ